MSNKTFKSFFQKNIVFTLSIILVTAAISSLITYLLADFKDANVKDNHINLIKTDKNFSLLISSNDLYEGEALRKNGYFKENIVKILPSIIESGDICIDVGAGYGYHTIAIAQLVGYEGRVIGFEPIKEIFDLLNLSLDMNKLSNVAAYNYILFSENIEGTLNTYNQYKTLSTFVPISNKKTDKNFKSFTSVKLDTIFPLLGNVKLLSLKQSGNEFAIIKGAKEIIARSPDISIIMFWDSSKIPLYGNQYKSLIKDLIDLKFEFWVIAQDGSLKLIQPERIEEIAQADILITKKPI